tara:strand:- start:562 stop:1167 length:606 start_codon:yes stop_codon:yes gene_type:complete
MRFGFDHCCCPGHPGGLCIECDPPLGEVVAVLPQFEQVAETEPYVCPECDSIVGPYSLTLAPVPNDKAHPSSLVWNVCHWQYEFNPWPCSGVQSPGAPSIYYVKYLHLYLGYAIDAYPLSTATRTWHLHLEMGGSVTQGEFSLPWVKWTADPWIVTEPPDVNPDCSFSENLERDFSLTLPESFLPCRPVDREAPVLIVAGA